MKKLIAVIVALVMSGCVAAAQAESVIDKLVRDPQSACPTMAIAYANGTVYYARGHDTAATVEIPAVITDPGDQRLWVDLVHMGIVATAEIFEQSTNMALERAELEPIGAMIYSELEKACQAARGNLAVIKALPNITPYVLQVIGQVEHGSRGERI